MPKTNPRRTLQNERNVARRVRLERESRGWSYEGLAQRMESVGYPVAASGLYKLEKGEPPRRVTVDELVGFSCVFGLDVATLLEPLEKELTHRAREMVKKVNAAATAVWESTAAFLEAQIELQRLATSPGGRNRDVLARVDEYLAPSPPDMDLSLAPGTDLDTPASISAAVCALMDTVRTFAEQRVAGERTDDE